MGMMLQAMAGVMVSMIIGFIFSWKFAFFALGVMPLILMSAIVQIKLAKGYAGKNDEALEGAGRVSRTPVLGVYEKAKKFFVFCQLNVIYKFIFY